MVNKCKLSVVIASYNSEKTIRACLESLENQTSRECFEIIVVDSSTDNTPAIIKEKFPQIRLYHFSERKFPGDARNIGISKARGEIIAIIDADCMVGENWLAGVLRAHQVSHLVIGGAIANANPQSYVGWAFYFCKFSQWLPDGPGKWLAEMATANISYKREVFEKFGNFIEGTYSSDTEICWRLGNIGLLTRFVPDIVIYHPNIDHLGRFLKHQFERGCAFAKVRAASQKFSKMKKFVYLMFSFFIPLKIF